MRRGPKWIFLRAYVSIGYGLLRHAKKRVRWDIKVTRKQPGKAGAVADAGRTSSKICGVTGSQGRES
jgi:hypothetical protein